MPHEAHATMTTSPRRMTHQEHFVTAWYNQWVTTPRRRSIRTNWNDVLLEAAQLVQRVIPAPSRPCRRVWAFPVASDLTPFAPQRRSHAQEAACFTLPACTDGDSFCFTSVHISSAHRLIVLECF